MDEERKEGIKREVKIDTEVKFDTEGEKYTNNSTKNKKEEQWRTKGSSL